jgi:hypothetical protein
VRTTPLQVRCIAQGALIRTERRCALLLWWWVTVWWQWWIRKSSANAFTGTLHRSRRALSLERSSLLSSFLSLVNRKSWFLRNVQHPHWFFRTAQDQLFFVITFICASCLRLQRVYGGERSDTEVIEHYFLQSVPAPVNWLPWY